SFNAFLLALVLAGILQIAMGALKTGFIADYVPSNVIQGLLCAIGILIIIKQIPFAFTYTEQHAELLELLKNNSETYHAASLKMLAEHVNMGATFIALISIAVLIFFDKTSNSRLKAIPGPIVVVVLGAIINKCYAWFLPALTQFTNELVNLPIHGDLKSFV